MKTYICPTIEIYELMLPKPALDNIGINHSMGMQEDAVNDTFFDDDKDNIDFWLWKK